MDFMRRMKLLVYGFLIYRVVTRLLFGDDDILENGVADSNVLLSVANRLEQLQGGKVYVGLRIPDGDTGLKQDIDAVFVSKGKAVVISVKNLSGHVSVIEDGSWVCEAENAHVVVVHPDPVEEAKRQALVLKSYLEQRGITLPGGYLSYSVIIPDPKFSTFQESCFASEVITYDKWVKLKPERRSKLSGWIEGVFRAGKKGMQQSLHQKLNYVFNTAPMWDRLELARDNYVLGEFLDFRGKREDTLALRCIKRSKVGYLYVRKTSLFCFVSSDVQVMYSPRDYRNEGSLSFERKTVCVSSDTEVAFRPQNSTRVCRFKLASIVSMSLSV